MSFKGKTITKSENKGVQLSKNTEVEKIPHEDYTPYSKDLNEVISAQQNFLNTHAQRLTNLIHSEVESLENEYLNSDAEERTRALSDKQLHSVTVMGGQLLETIKLSVAVSGVKMQIERGK